MTVFTEGRHPGEFIVSEGNGRIAREVVTILAGQTLEAGAVLSKNADGKYLAVALGASDGTEDAVAVLYADTDASTADTDAVIVARLAEVNGDQLVWPEGATEGQKATAIAKLAESNIIVR